MTIREAINRVDSTYPNQYSDDVKIAWLSDLDYRVFNELFITHEGNFYTLTAPVLPGQIQLVFPYTDDTTALLVPSPYDVLYSSYIKAKIDELNEETTRYANSAAQFNTNWQDYARFYNRTHMPITRRPDHAPCVPPVFPFPHMDEHPSPSSQNPVMSCGIYYALQDKADKNEIPENITDLQTDSNHQTVSAAEKAAWNDKQDALTFDTAPTSGSDNPVTSGGVYAALQDKANTGDVPSVLGDLSNVAFNNLQDGDVLKYQGGGWTNGQAGGGGTTVVANPTLVGTEDALTSVQIEDTKYKVESGTEVVANPTLVGTESSLTSIQIGDTKYKIESGGTSDYDDLTDKPQINGVILSGNKTLANLGIEPASVSVTGTLTAGQTGITLSNAAITTSSTIDIYTDAYGVNPTGVTVASGSITLTFAAQLSDLGVKAVIR